MSGKPASGGTAGKGVQRCSVCGKPAVSEFRPFCSRRCADVDLSRWLGGVDAIPTADADADEDGEDVTRVPPPRQTGGDE